MAFCIIDATLREGNQARPGGYTPEESEIIAFLLDRLGVEMIECGHPAIGGRERERIARVRALPLECELLGHARAVRSDIEHVAQSGLEWAGIFIGVNALSRDNKLKGCSEEDAISLAADAVAHARRLGLKVRFTVEDASRTDDELLERTVRAAVEAGANRLCYADTTGCLTPNLTTSAITDFVRWASPAEVEVHFHDDRGLAHANVLFAIKAGARWISTSVNGVGERCGIPDLALVMTNLNRNFDPVLLQELSRFVGAVSASPPDDRRPVVGKRAFSHSAKLHRDAVLRDESVYAWRAAEEFGRAPVIVDNCRPDPSALITNPPVICATELKFHRSGPGDRYVFVDDRLVTGCNQYAIVRDIPPVSRPPGHVDSHVHSVDSAWLFIGRGEGLTGLTVEVALGDTIQIVQSPAGVHIPAGLEHSYRVIEGSGLYINHVQAGNYNDSLIETHSLFRALREAGSIGRAAEIRKFVFDQIAKASGASENEIAQCNNLLEANILDSVSLIELYLSIDETFGPLGSTDGLPIEEISSVQGLVNWVERAIASKVAHQQEEVDAGA